MSFRIFFSLLIALSLKLFISLSYGQDYSPIANFNGYASKMATDTVNNVMYIAGGFNLANGISVQGLCKYDGQNVSPINNVSLAPFQTTYFTIQDIIVFQGSLYVSSQNIYEFGQVENTPIDSRIFRFNGFEWESVFHEFGFCRAFEVIDDKLYLLGSTFSNTPLLGIYDGFTVNYHYFNSTILNVDDWIGVSTCLVKYDNSILIGGDFNRLSEEGGQTDLLVFDESNGFDLFEHAPNELAFTISQYITSMTVWNGKLVAAGSINIGANSYTLGVGILIDGFWEPIGGMVPVMAGIISGLGPIEDLLVIDAHLFIVGGFTNYSDPQQEIYPVSHVGYVIDNDFFRLSNDIFVPPSTLLDITVFNDTIYLCGNFQHINTYAASSVVKFIGQNPVTTNTISYTKSNGFRIHPNPSSQTVYLNSPDITPGSFVRIYNLSGQLVYELNVLEQSTSLAIATSNIGPPGMYVVQLHSPGKAMAVQKLVVAE
jgi:hypothetical protein